ncbi:MAG TPA: hypothetical protein VJC13_01015 [Candidatus Paceibacterota bacterium]|nr:hypothetical protein [uncultured archaeon]
MSAENPDVIPVERPFVRGDSLFGYDKALELNGEIIGITGERGELRKGMEVGIVGNSMGYVPSGHKPGEMVTITGFVEPFQDGASDHIITVSGGGITGRVKPSNIKLI